MSFKKTEFPGTKPCASFVKTVATLLTSFFATTAFVIALFRGKRLYLNVVLVGTEVIIKSPFKSSSARPLISTISPCSKP